MPVIYYTYYISSSSPISDTVKQEHLDVYKRQVAIIPWAPEPVILMAGLSRPITLASIAALHNNEAVACSFEEITCLLYTSRCV